MRNFLIPFAIALLLVAACKKNHYDCDELTWTNGEPNYHPITNFKGFDIEELDTVWLYVLKVHTGETDTLLTGTNVVEDRYRIKPDENGGFFLNIGAEPNIDMVISISAVQRDYHISHVTYENTEWVPCGGRPRGKGTYFVMTGYIQDNVRITDMANKILIEK